MRSENTTIIAIIVVLLVGVLVALIPTVAEGQTANFVFVTDPRTAKPGVVSDQITVQAQGSGGESVSIPQTGCLLLKSVSQGGQFSSNASNWNPVSILTMNRNTSNRSFYYMDSSEGTHTLTVKAVLKPEEESRSCASWPIEEWSTGWTVTQAITISSNALPGSAPTPPSGAPSSTSPPSVPAVSNDLIVEAGSDRSVIAGADISFLARAYRNKEALESVGFMWNFGDGSTAQGAAVIHRFEYPGRHSVVVIGSRDGATGSDRFTVTAERAQLAVRALPDGSVEIENLSGRDVDLSRWIVQSSGQRFILPDNSSVLAKQVMRISPNTLHFYAGSKVELDYPDGTLAFRAGENAPETMSSATSTTPAASPISMPPPAHVVEQSPSKTLPAKNILGDEEDPSEPTVKAQEQESFATSSNVAATATVATGAWQWWLGALAIGALAGGAVFVSRRVGRREWNIVEE